MTATDDSISLRAYLTSEIDAVRREVAALESRIALVRDAHNRSHDREHQMTELAVRKAEESMGTRLESMNEFRQQITDERRTYMTRDEFRRIEDAWTRRLDDIAEDVRVQDNRWSNLQGKGAAVGALLAALTLAAVFLGLWAKLS